MTPGILDNKASRLVIVPNPHQRMAHPLAAICFLFLRCLKSTISEKSGFPEGSAREHEGVPIIEALTQFIEIEVIRTDP